MRAKRYHGLTRDAAPKPVVRRGEVLQARPDLEPIWREAHEAFPVLVTRSLWGRMDPHDPNDPIARQVLPDARELDAHPAALADPVGEKAHSPLPWVIHKHPDRVLLMATKRCHVYCRFCFRRTHAPSERLDPSPEEWDAALDYARSSGASEVILSGGDPLVLSDEKLSLTLGALQGAVPTVRVHTRAPISSPDRVTEGLIRVLRQAPAAWVVVHCNHSAELSAEVTDALARMVDSGIPVLNQSVLLKGVNDDPEVLAELSENLVKRRVFPYYLHHTDRVEGTSHFWVSAERGRVIFDQLSKRVSGLALPKYVWDPPDGTGKKAVSSETP